MVTKRGVFIILIYVIIVLSSTLVGTLLGGPMAGAITAFLVASGSIIFSPFKRRISEWVESTMFKRDGYRIYVFGRPGSGKTSLIRSILTSGHVAPPKSTDTFDYYRAHINLDRNGRLHPFEVHVGDYKGQKPSQMTIDAPVVFVGNEGHRSINAVIFVVDIAPRMYNEETGEPYHDEKIRDWLLSGDTSTKINQRVREHFDYIGESTLEIIFRIVYSKNLRSVRLLINKRDLLEDVVVRGGIPHIAPSETERYGVELFAALIHHIQRACRANHIDDFSYHVVSAKEGTGLRAVLSDILDTRSVATR